jgi:hypothetical protein
MQVARGNNVAWEQLENHEVDWTLQRCERAETPAEGPVPRYPAENSVFWS